MPWWRTAVLYEIYPRSFQDADGNGVGDLRGIAQRLPYLSELGVDAIWILPVFPSPMADFGYDISDYTGIDPLFGSLEDPTRCWRRPKRTASRFCSIWYRTIPPTSTLVPGESLLDITKVLVSWQ